MHIVISAEGETRQIKLTRSTDSPELDSACVDVMRAARFMPAQRDGQNVAAATEVWLAWRLPE
jgi:TonB family protein